MNGTMRSLRLAGDERVELQEVPIPRPAPDEVLVQTVVSAVCGSELGAYRGAGLDGGNLGHEAAGYVVEIGDEVTGLRVGDRVGVSAISGCGHCRACERGRYTWCRDHRFTASMHAEYFTTPANGCHRLPDRLSWENAVLITGDGLGVPYHTQQKLQRFEPSTVAVFGLGPIGLGTVLLQAHLGKRVVGVDLSEERLQLARELGAEATVLASSGKDARSAVEAALGARPQVCIEAAGSPITARQCFATVDTGGIVVFNGEQGEIRISPSEDLIRRDITAIGSWFYHFAEYEGMLQLVDDGLEVSRLISHRVDFGDAADAFAAMAGGRTAKAVLTHPDLAPAATDHQIHEENPHR